MCLSKFYSFLILLTSLNCLILDHFLQFFFKSQWYLAQYPLRPPEFTCRCRWLPGCLQFPTWKPGFASCLPAGCVQRQACPGLPARRVRAPRSASLRRVGVGTSCPSAPFYGGIILRPAAPCSVLTQEFIVDTISTFFLLAISFCLTPSSSPSLVSWDHLPTKADTPTFLSPARATWCALKDSHIPLSIFYSIIILVILFMNPHLCIST